MHIASRVDRDEGGAPPSGGLRGDRRRSILASPQLDGEHRHAPYSLATASNTSAWQGSSSGQ